MRAAARLGSGLGARGLAEARRRDCPTQTLWKSGSFCLADWYVRGAGAVRHSTDSDVVSNRHRTHAWDCPPGESGLPDYVCGAFTWARTIGGKHETRPRDHPGSWRPPPAARCRSEARPSRPGIERRPAREPHVRPGPVARPAGCVGHMRRFEMTRDQLVLENEALHALLADASATLMAYAGAELGQAATDCLERIARGEPDPTAAPKEYAHR
jgi:hypothetical protein